MIANSQPKPYVIQFMDITLAVEQQKPIWVSHDTYDLELLANNFS